MASPLKIAIVGGVAGGAAAAARLRRLDEAAHIMLFEKGPAVSFSTCGMPYYLGATIKNRGDLFITPNERLEHRFKVELFPFTEVTKIDRAAKTLTYRHFEEKDGRVVDGSVKYDKLLLATGARPIMLDAFKGLPHVHTLRGVKDMDAIGAALAKPGLEHVTVIGAGFIGLELVENLVNRGIKSVALVDVLPQVLGALDFEMVRDIEKELRAKGIKLYLGDPATGAQQQEDRLLLTLKSGQSFQTDLVILGVGVAPDSSLAKDAGLELGMKGAVKVDEFMRTSDADIFACGDVIETKDFVTGLPTIVPLAGPANRQARIAADNILGRKDRYRGTQGTAIVKVFGQTAASTGATERQLKAAKIPYRKIYTDPAHHSTYFPGAKLMAIKLMFSPADGRILGAQIAGTEGVDTQIDVLATAIQAHQTVYDLEEAELAYSPQYGAAKSIANMLGFVAADELRGDQIHCTVEELEQKRAEGAVLINVLPKSSFDADTVPGSLSFPLDELRGRLSELPKDKEIVVICRHGQTANNAFRI